MFINEIEMTINNICRLCMSGEELIWVFDKILTGMDNLAEVILVTTGVEILKKDIISQKICKNCRSVSTTMFSFRKRAEETDKYLKVKCKEFLKSSDVTMRIPNTSVSIKSNKRCIKDVTNRRNSVSTPSMIPKISIKPISRKTNEPLVRTDTKIELPIQCSEIKINQISATKEIPKSTKKMVVHSSIDEIFATNKKIKIPSSCLSIDVNPIVCMKMDDVENYFRLNNLDMKKAVQTGLKSLRATKKTGAIHKHTPSVANVEENKTDLINKERRVSPISIKAKAEDKSHFTVIAKDNDKRKIDDSDSEDIPTTKINKAKLKRRRLSSSDLSVENDIQKPSLMESLGLKDAHRSNICRYQQFNAKSLGDHIKEHFRCRFCRTTCKILDQKENHEKTCKHKQRLTSTPYVGLQRVDNILKLLTKSPVVETSSTGNISQWTDKNQKDEVIELSDDDDDKSNLTHDVTSVSATTPSLLVVNDVKTNCINTSKVPDMDIPKLIPLHYVDNFSIAQPAQYTSTGIVKPSIQIIDNSMLNSVDTSSSDVKALKELLTSTKPVHMKLCVDGESQTDLPSNDQIIKDTSKKTAKLKNLLCQLFIYKIPVDVQKGYFDITYNKSETPERKNKMQFWNKTKAIDIKSPNFTYFNTYNLKKHIDQGISLLRPVSSTPFVLNSTLAGITLGENNGQSKNQSSHPLYFSKTLDNTNQNVSQNTNYATDSSNSVPINFYPTAPTTFFNSNPLQVVATGVNPNTMTYVMQNAVSNSSLQNYVDASANIPSNSSIYLSNNTQNLNLPVTYTNANNSNRSMPLSSLTDISTSNNVVLSTEPNIQNDVNSIPATVLPDMVSNTYLYSNNVNVSSNNLFGNGLTAGYNVCSDSNVSVHNDYMSASMSQVATSSGSIVNNVVQMPLIRVRNLCELR